MSALRRWGPRFTQAAFASPWRQWATVFAGVALVYLLTAQYIPPFGWDSTGAWVPAHWFATHGTFYLDEFMQKTGDRYSDIPWFVQGAGGHIVTNRQPGIVLAGVPTAFVLRTDSGVLGGVTGAVWSAAGMATLSLVFRRMLSLRAALAATVVAAFGTSVWSVSADKLWPHSVDALLLPLALLALAAGRYGRTGWAFGASILVRAHLAVGAAVVGIWESVRTRSWRPLFFVGLPAGVGLAALLVWNHYFFGSWSLAGGGAYANYVMQNLQSTPIPGVHGPKGGSIGHEWFGVAYLMRYVGMLFSPSHGLIAGSPFLLILIPGLRAGWRAAPSWARAAAAGGLGYLVVQQQINTFEGSGTGFYSYRYPIEALLLAAPLLASAHAAWVRPRAWRVRTFRVLVAASLCTQATGALFFGNVPAKFSPWREWPFVDVVVSNDVRGAIICALTLAALVTAALLPVKVSTADVDGDVGRHADPRIHLATRLPAVATRSAGPTYPAEHRARSSADESGSRDHDLDAEGASRLS